MQSQYVLSPKITYLVLSCNKLGTCIHPCRGSSLLRKVLTSDALLLQLWHPGYGNLHHIFPLHLPWLCSPVLALMPAIFIDKIVGLSLKAFSELIIDLIIIAVQFIPSSILWLRPSLKPLSSWTMNNFSALKIIINAVFFERKPSYLCNSIMILFFLRHFLPPISLHSFTPKSLTL